MSIAAEMNTRSAPVKRPAKGVVPLFTVDGRTRLGRRVAELEAIFAEALGNKLTDVQVQQVRQAAQLNCIAEVAAERYLRGSDLVTLDDLVRVQRAAALALRRLNIGAAPASPKVDLDAYLASKRKAAEPCA